MPKITLSNREIKTLAWLADRGYFPVELYDALYLHEDALDAEDVEPDTPRVWIAPRAAVGSLARLQRDDPAAFLACLARGPLRDKVLALMARNRHRSA